MHRRKPTDDFVFYLSRVISRRPFRPTDKTYNPFYLKMVCPSFSEHFSVCSGEDGFTRYFQLIIILNFTKTSVEEGYLKSEYFTHFNHPNCSSTPRLANIGPVVLAHLSQRLKWAPCSMPVFRCYLPFEHESRKSSALLPQWFWRKRYYDYADRQRKLTFHHF